MERDQEIIEPIIEPMDQSIFQKTYEVGETLLELDFDELIKSDIMEVVPILRAINIISKGGLRVRDRFFMKKVVLFIKQYNSGLSTEDKQKFVSNILTDVKFRKKVNEKILILLDRFDDEFKALILAELLKGWVKGKINWRQFRQLSFLVERTHPCVFRYLYDFYNIHGRPSTASFILQGNFPPNEIALILGSGLGGYNDKIFAIWRDALLICEYGLKEFFGNDYEQMPKDIDDYLKNHWREALNDPKFKDIFSEYESFIINWRAQNNYGNWFRKDLISKLRRYLSEKSR